MADLGTGRKQLPLFKRTVVFRPAASFSPVLALAPVVFSKSPKPGAIALRLDFDLKGRDPTARSEGPVLANGKSLVQA